MINSKVASLWPVPKEGRKEEEGGGWREHSNTNWVRRGSEHFTYINLFYSQITPRWLLLFIFIFCFHESIRSPKCNFRQ